MVPRMLALELYQMVHFRLMAITNELIIDAPVERVWALTADVESWPATTPTMTSVERLDDGPIRVGSRARIKQPRQPSRVWTVTSLEPGSLFAWETRILGVRMIGSHRLGDAGDGRCRNTLGVELIGRFAGLIETLSRRQLLAAITTENQGFRQAAETARR